jgi:hypothetical protein
VTKSYRRWRGDAALAADAHFLLTGIPPTELVEPSVGAGKTFYGLHRFADAVKNGRADFVVIVARRVAIGAQWVKAARKDFGLHLVRGWTPGMALPEDCDGVVITPQSVRHGADGEAPRQDEFVTLVKAHRTMLIVDEVHHCAGNGASGIATDLLAKVAIQRLYLSGTTWRSDGKQIAGLDYDAEGYAIPTSLPLRRGARRQSCTSGRLPGLRRDRVLATARRRVHGDALRDLGRELRPSSRRVMAPDSPLFRGTGA